jgi:DNA-binding transcriptional LysR family regulator
MELLDLHIFSRVAQEGSISRAAAALHMAQPSVSQRLLALEAELGRPLFVRHRRGVALTSAGQALMPYVERALTLIGEGVEAVRAEGVRLRIALAAPPSIGGHFLPPLLQRLAMAGHEVALESAHSHEVMQQLLDGAIHAGFLLPMPARSGIVQQVVHRDPIRCVAAPDHPLARQAAVRLRDLAAYPLVIYAFAHPGYLELRDRMQEQVGRPLQGLTKASPVEAALRLAREGGFITFVPEMTVAADLAARRLVTLSVTDLPPYFWEIVVAYRERKTPDPAVAALLAALHAT